MTNVTSSITNALDPDEDPVALRTADASVDDRAQIGIRTRPIVHFVGIWPNPDTRMPNHYEILPKMVVNRPTSVTEIRC